MSEQDAVPLQDYDWKMVFSGLLDGQPKDAVVSINAGKLRGLVAAYESSVDTIQVMVQERADMMRTIGALAVENAKLLAAPKAPRKIQIGDRVKANDTAGFHKGAEGVVQFVEPSYDKVWVLRDRSSGPVFYHPSELDVLVENNSVEVVKE